jgi:hypothetical protein
MFLADILMTMIISGIFVSQLQIVGARSEFIALTVLLGLGIKSVFLFLLIVFELQPALWRQLTLTAGTLFVYILWVGPQLKYFLSVFLELKREKFSHTKILATLGILFALGMVCAIYFPVTGADGIWYHVKGMVYFHEARFDSERIIPQLRQYPPMIGLLYAWLISGGIERLPIIFPVLYFCLLIVVFHRLWDHSESSKTAAIGTLVLGTTPYLWWHSFLPFLDLTATVFFALGILYWFSLIKNILISAEGVNVTQNKSLALLSGLLLGFSSWTRPEFVLFSALPLFLAVCVFDRNEKSTSEREHIILRFGLASLILPSLWFAVLLNFNGSLDSSIKQLIMACVGLWLGLGLILLRVVRFPSKIARLVIVTAFVLCLVGLLYAVPQDISLWNTFGVRIFRFFAVHIFFAGTIFLVLIIFTEKIEQLSIAEKILGIFLLLFLVTQFFIYAYSGFKWPTLLHYIENTFVLPGNSINLSDTRGALTIYPAFIFFIFCFRSIREGVNYGWVRRFLYLVVGVNLVVILSIFAGPRIKYIANNLDKSYEERSENSGPLDMPNQFTKTYRVAHQLKKHVVSGQFLLLPPGNREGSFRSVMTQVLFSQKLIFANDSYLWKKFQIKEPRPPIATERVGDNKLCNETEVEVLGKTGFVFCRVDQTHFNFLE